MFTARIHSVRTDGSVVCPSDNGKKAGGGRGVSQLGHFFRGSQLYVLPSSARALLLVARAANDCMALCDKPRCRVAGLFEDDIDYASGKKDQPSGWPKPTATKEACCAACKAEDGCAAGVWGPPDDPKATCWFKSVDEVKKGKGKPYGNKKTVACTLQDDNGNPEVGGDSGSDGLLVLLGVAVLVYGVGGCAVGFVQGKRARDGLAQMHPHSHLWREWGGLATDGLALLRPRSGLTASPRGGGGAGRSQYAPLGDAEAPDLPSKDAKRSSEKSKKSKEKLKSKEGKSDRSAEKRDKERRPSRSSIQADPAPAPEVAAPVSTAMTRKPVAYRGDEHLVKPTPTLSAGARETGVKVTL